MTTSRILLRSASLDDLDRITDLHTRARTAYYRAGGFSEPELTSPEARARRREMWMRALGNDAMTVLCAVSGGETWASWRWGRPWILTWTPQL